MARNVLFLVTGMTPQIITETIWALACDPSNDEQWIPDEVHVLSTNSGLQQIRQRLFKDGVFERFQQDYPSLKNINFIDDNQYLHIISNSNEEPLNDLKDPDDNENAANLICEMIKNFTDDNQVSLHVSIAGGRKTMGFYAGYALSLYGRAQDSMSHVLVEEDFEKATNFFYPTPHSYLVSDRDGIVKGDAKDATIWLANIPFVRMRDAILPKHQLKQSKDSFSDVVSKINESFNTTHLAIHAHNKTIVVNDKFVVDDLPAREFAFLYWFAEMKKQGKKGVNAPTANITEQGVSAKQLQYIGELSHDFSQYYLDYKVADNTEIDRSIETSVDKKFFNSAKSKLNTYLTQHLGMELAAKLAITQSTKCKPFQLAVDEAYIDIIDTFK